MSNLHQSLKEFAPKHFFLVAIALLPSAVLSQQFTPQQMLDVMTKSPSNRDVRVQDAAIAIPMYEDITVNDEETELRALLQQLRNEVEGKN